MPYPVTAIILAGGRGSRFGNADKGWVHFRDQPMIEHVLARLAPQVDDICISCNRNLEAYRALGYPCVSDERPDYPGPLAGIAAGLAQASRELVVVVPCDAPLLPDTLLKRLYPALLKNDADICYAWDGTRDQYLYAVMKRSLKPELDAYLQRGGRSVKGWYAQQVADKVDCSDLAAGFVNINSASELQALG